MSGSSQLTHGLLIKQVVHLIVLVLALEHSLVECGLYEPEEEVTSYPRFELNNEKRLITHLLGNYKVKYGRPVANRTENIVVKLEVFLVQIIDLDERNQVLISNVETQYEWYDNGLKWDRELYGGIHDVRLPVNQIWTPDIVLYNYADTRLEEKREVLAIINSNGRVRWRPSSIFKSTCQINIQNFPYDHQSCRMKFGSWTYDGDSIDIQFLNKPEINQELFLKSNEWEVLSTSGQRNEKKYECCLEYFPDITFQINMMRKGGFYNYILVLPCILLSLLTMVLFWLPPESPAKMLLGMNIFTSFFVLLLLLSKNVPSATDKIPLIGAYYCLNMVMIATSTCACTVVVHIYFRGNGKVPYILRKVFLEFLARVLCMEGPPVPKPRQDPPLPRPIDNTSDLYNSAIVTTSSNKIPQTLNRSSLTLANLDNTVRQQKQLIYESRISLNSTEPGHNIGPHDRLQTQTSLQHNSYAEMSEAQQQRASLGYAEQVYVNARSSGKRRSAAAGISAVPLLRQGSRLCDSQQNQQDKLLCHQKNDRLNQELNFSFHVIENDIKEIRDYLRHTRKRIQVTDISNKNMNEWKRLALILDRTLFFIYIIVIVISMTLMFPR